MSAQPIRKPAVAEGNKQTGRIKGLMLEMGVPYGQFTGIPPDQHKWQELPGPDNPPLHRMWSCMIHYTCCWGHESPFAVSSDGHELHMENLAELLGMDLANAYRTWRKGVRLGIWRNGSHKEGKRRLYLCGKVEPKEGEEAGEDKANQIVCTDNLPPYLEKIVNGWPADRAKVFRAGWRRQIAVRNAMLANCMAAGRWACDQFDDTFLGAWKLPKTRLAREEFSVDERLAKAATSHIEELAPAVARKVRLDELTAAAWDALPDAERQARIKAALEELAAEYRAGHTVAGEYRSGRTFRGWDKQRWDREAEALARQHLCAAIAAELVENPVAELSVQTVNQSVQSAEVDGYHAPETISTTAHPYSQTLTDKGQNSEQSLHTPPTTPRGGRKPLPVDSHKQLHTELKPEPWSAADVKAVYDAVQSAWGSPLLPGDDVPKKLLEIGWKLVAPKIVAAVLECWIQDFAAEKQAKNYPIESPNLFAAAAARSLPPWIRGHGDLLARIADVKEREALDRRREAMRQLFDAMPAWHKLVPGGPVISFDVPEHLAGVLAVVDELRGADVLAFSIFVSSKLRGMDHAALAKLPGRPVNAPAGPRLLGVLVELAREFRRDQTKGARR